MQDRVLRVLDGQITLEDSPEFHGAVALNTNRDGYVNLTPQQLFRLANIAREMAKEVDEQ